MIDIKQILHNSQKIQPTLPPTTFTGAHGEMWKLCNAARAVENMMWLEASGCVNVLFILFYYLELYAIFFAVKMLRGP